MTDTASQTQVVERYRDFDGVKEVATVGEYVRVKKAPGSGEKTCFGPVANRDPLNWRVVEIDWENLEFLLAPKQ